MVSNFTQSCVEIAAAPRLETNRAFYLRAATFAGGGNSTTTSREPQRGQRNRLSSRDKGKSRPRAQTSVSMSTSARKVHSRLCVRLSSLP
jgi:hypothetical protein